MLYSRVQLVQLINTMQLLPDSNAVIFCQNSTNITYKEFLSSIHKLQQVAKFFPRMDSLGMW